MSGRGRKAAMTYRYVRIFILHHALIDDDVKHKRLKSVHKLFYW